MGDLPGTTTLEVNTLSGVFLLTDGESVEATISVVTQELMFIELPGGGFCDSVVLVVLSEDVAWLLLRHSGSDDDSPVATDSGFDVWREERGAGLGCFFAGDGCCGGVGLLFSGLMGSSKTSSSSKSDRPPSNFIFNTLPREVRS